MELHYVVTQLSMLLLCAIDLFTQAVELQQAELHVQDRNTRQVNNRVNTDQKQEWECHNPVSQLEKHQQVSTLPAINPSSLALGSSSTRGSPEVPVTVYFSFICLQPAHSTAAAQGKNVFQEETSKSSSSLPVLHPIFTASHYPLPIPL